MDNSTENSPDPKPVPPIEPAQKLLTAKVPHRPPPLLPPLNANLKGFLNLTGGSLFYCLSALSIIYGITEIMGPLLLKPNVLNETLPCIGALNLYEVALLGILVFIVAWRKVTDDAISLVVLIPLFLIGSGIALDTVANNGPTLSLVIGLLCAAVGGVKLAVLRQTIKVPLGGMTMAGLLLLVAWNFLTGPALVKLFADHTILPAAKRSLWLGGLLLLLIVGTLALIELIRKPGPAPDKNTPFLRAPPMVSVFLLVILGAAGAHLYALGYQFDMRFSDGDFMLLATLGVILLLETMDRYRDSLNEVMAVVGCAPLIGTGFVLATDGFTAPFQWSLELLGHPSTVLVVGGLGMLRMGMKTRWTPFFWIAGIYGLAVVLTGFSPPDPAAFNWRLCFGLFVITLLTMGIILKRANLCVAAVILSASGLGTSHHFIHAAKVIGLSTAGGVAGFFGMGILIIAIIYKDKTLIPLVVIAAAALVGTAFDFVTNAIGWRDFVILCVLGTIGTLSWWRLRAPIVVAVLGLPLLVRLWLLFCTLSTWRYVVLSFILLGVGAWLSIIKSRKQVLQEKK